MNGHIYITITGTSGYRVIRFGSGTLPFDFSCSFWFSGTLLWGLVLLLTCNVSQQTLLPSGLMIPFKTHSSISSQGVTKNNSEELVRIYRKEKKKQETKVVIHFSF